MDARRRAVLDELHRVEQWMLKRCPSEEFLTLSLPAAVSLPRDVMRSASSLSELGQ